MTSADALPSHLHLSAVHPVADPRSVVSADTWRISVLTSRLLRFEYSAAGRFEDRATQVVVDRLFDVPEYTVREVGGRIELVTEHLAVDYDGGPFTPNGLNARLLGGVSNYHSHWRYGEAGTNLGGTARTLDGADGRIALGPGLMSVDGYAVLDDSGSLALDDAGWFAPRSGGSDLYLFGYGHDYRGCLRDWFHLAGPTPLIPRWALGNWWSRYHPYSAEEYLALLDEFARRGIPFSVAVLDMDWHPVDIDPALGSGWTGYSWNRDLFPDPEAFLAELHRRGLRVTLNVHPADGVRSHEDAYPAMAAALGVDPASGAPIAFDVTNPAFLAAYFATVHHPREDEGVDFWWLDWQSGPHSAVEGLDPLWALNHFHFLDSAREGRMPLTFSRYAGPGSHRYPIGFSGDTVASWESLAFQPEFTATAANIGYGWWSHDIGGHMFGARDDELATRWVQFGVFSPILRLHSAIGRFRRKEPWEFGPEASAVMTDFLRLRHRLLPYLDTMNHRAAEEGRLLVEPMYYEHPSFALAYDLPNQYAFGSELIAAPVTRPIDPAVRLAATRVGLPPGLWWDWFTGIGYEGYRRITAWRPLGRMPVFARAGAIVPLGPVDADAGARPDVVHVRVFAGASGSFELVEGGVRTPFVLDWEGGTFSIGAVDGDGTRDWTIEFVGFAAPSSLVVAVGGSEIPVTGGLTVSLSAVAARDRVVVRFEGGTALAPHDPSALIEEVLHEARIDYLAKDTALAVVSGAQPLMAVGGLQGFDLPPALIGALTELLTARA